MKKVHFSILMAIMCCLFFMISCGGGGGGGTQVVSELPTPDISVSKTNVDLGGVVQNSSAVQTLTIQSTGTANLSIGQIQILGTNSPFSIDTLVSTCASNMPPLAPAQTCSLTVRFAPTTLAQLGVVSDTLRINSNDPNASTVDVSLGGTGYGLNVWINKIDTTGCQADVDVTVTDPTSPNLLSLTQANFTLSQNGQSQSFQLTQVGVASPVTLVLAMDWSDSTLTIRPVIQSAAQAFINQLHGGDWAAICKFSDVIEFFPLTTPLFIEATSSGKTELSGYIMLPFSKDGTKLYDALYQSIERVAQGTTDKRVVIVVSDGNDQSGSDTLNQVIAYAKSEGIPIFTIYYNDPQYQGGNYGKPEIMQQLANETGGQYYIAPTGADFTSIFQQIANVLSNKYTLTYTSSICPGTVDLNVRADLNGLYGQDSRAISF